jgi:hypothetical protein
MWYSQDDKIYRVNFRGGEDLLFIDLRELSKGDILRHYRRPSEIVK